MKKIYLYLKFIRIQNLCIAFLVVALSTYMLQSTNISLFVINFLIIIITMSFGYIDNDLSDLKNDKINHPQRVLVSKKISIKDAQILRIILTIIMVLISIFITYESKLFYYVFIIPCLISYNRFFKKTPLLGNIIVSYLLASTFLFIDFSITGSMTNLWLPALLAFHLSLIREIFKDLHDSLGDSEVSMQTLPIVLGIDKTCQGLSIYIFCCFVGFLMPYFMNYYTYKYLISLFFFIEIPLIYSLLLLLNSQTIQTFRNMTFLYKILTINGLFVIFLTQF